jgi:acyl carrier protein
MIKITMNSIIEGVKEVFPECNDMAMTHDTQLGQLPEWDSMAAVNLQTYFQQQFEIEIPLELLGDQTNLQEIMAFLETPVSSEIA